MQISLVQESSTRHESLQAAAGQISAQATVFIDSAVEDLATLIDGVQPGVKVVTLDPCRDGVEQITAVLQREPHIGAVHIVSHGAPGGLYLGDAELSLETLERYAQELEAWREHGATSLLLYGCNLAAGDAGAEFLERLHHITRLPIAASRTKTGNSTLGGDWQLEVTVGLQNEGQEQVFAAVFIPGIQHSYGGVFTGARLLKDIRPESDSFGDRGSFPQNFTEFDGRLFFTADISDVNSSFPNRQLWVTDGTTEGTQLFKDISGSFLGSEANYFTEVDGQLFFAATNEKGRELWISDGTTEATQLLRDIGAAEQFYPGSYPFDLTEFNGKLFFSAFDNVAGRELWVSDGTTEGTQLLKDIRPGNISSRYPSSSFARDFTEVGGKLVFTADDGVTGNELWITDGTAEGTQLLKDIRPGNTPLGYPDGSEILNFTEVDGKLFFTANDGVTGNELWITDGTAEGTQLLKDINLGTEPNGDSASSNASNFAQLNGKVVFTADDGTPGRELWISDGTTEGTQLLKDINSGSDPNTYDALSQFRFAELDGKLFFTTNDPISGQELWVTDGTTEGTQLVKGFELSNYGFGSDSLVAVDGKLFFSANDGVTGQELWISDGTTAGTQLFQDIALSSSPSSSSSSPLQLNAFGNQLLFSANDGLTNQELWIASIPKNIIVGDENNDVLNGTADGDFIVGLSGNDVIRGRGGGDVIRGENGDDVLFGNGGDDLLNGEVGNDQIFGDAGRDTLNGGVGNDILNGGAGNDTVIVSDFRDIDTFDGGAGNDLIRFEPTDNRNLTIFLDQGAVGDGRGGGQFFQNFEQFATGRGNDRLLGDARANTFDGGLGNDELRGEVGRDNLRGNDGDDSLVGGQGADTLTGGRGSDVLVGDAGADTFRFDVDVLGVSGDEAETDTISDFQAQDRFDFTGYLSAGGTIEATRVSSGSLRLDLSNGNAVDVFGSRGGLDAAEFQLATIMAPSLT